MEKKYKILIVAFYLAKFDKLAIEKFNCQTFSEIKNLIGDKLDCKPNTIKNRRDDFDSIFPYRKGWYQRELSPKHLDVIEKFDNLSEVALRTIVNSILEGDSNEVLEDLDEKLETRNSNNNNLKVREFTTRSITGKAAEEYFYRYYHPSNFKEEKLNDTREAGTGYDFEVLNSKKVYEVKGLKELKGGIQFTDKEWNKAMELQENYVVVLVKNALCENKEVVLYADPTNILNAQQKVIQVTSINWNVSDIELSRRKMVDSINDEKY